MGALACLFALLPACGRINYDPLASEDASTSEGAPPDAAIDGGTAPDAASPDSDASPSAADLRLIGSDSCQSTTSTINIDAPGVAAGEVVVGQFVIRSDSGDVSASDSRGNNYVLLAAPGGTELRAHIFAAEITSALTAGDSIVLTHPSGGSTSAMAIALEGVQPAPFGVSAAGADDNTISIPFAPAPSGVAFCGFGVRNTTFEVGGPWLELSNTTADCGGAAGESHNVGYWLPASTAGVSACEGAILGGAQQWQGAIVTFAAAQAAP